MRFEKISLEIRKTLLKYEKISLRFENSLLRLEKISLEILRVNICEDLKKSLFIFEKIYLEI